MRKFLDYFGTFLGVIGMLLLIGSVVVWTVGLEMLSELYEKTRPVLPYFLTGLGLVVLACFLSPNLRKPDGGPPGTQPDPGTAPEGKLRCGKCEALNDGHAKFCN